MSDGPEKGFWQNLVEVRAILFRSRFARWLARPPVRILLFVGVLVVSWCLCDAVLDLLGPAHERYLVRFFANLAAVVLSFALMVGVDFVALGKERIEWIGNRNFRPRHFVAIGFEVLALYTVSWSFVYLVAGKLNLAEAVRDRFWADLAEFLLTVFVAYGVILPIGWFAGTRLREFFSTLTQALERISEGDYSVKVPPFSRSAGTEFDRVASDVNRVAAALKTLEQMRQEFVSNVSHEIQTPLTSMAGFTQALKDETLSPEERRRYLDILLEETERLSRLSDNLLKLSSLDAQARLPEPEEFRLDTQLREVILSMERIWEAKGLIMEPVLETRVVRGDRDLLHQVWTNLFQNAVKFTPPGGRVKVELTREGEVLRVSFEDSGVGIEADDLPFVFDRFFKADRSRQRSVRGNGLGLAIVKKIVELHGGTVEAFSGGPGRGSRFLVRLPDRAG